MAQVAILIPTFGRAKRIPDVVKNALENTPEGKVYLIVEEKDPDSHQKIKGSELVVGNFGTYAKAINAGFKKTTEPYLFAGADDLEFKEDWFTQAQKLMGPTKVVGTNDLHHPDVLLGNHATHYLIDRKYIENTGGVFDQDPGIVLYDGYDHNYTDTEFIETAQTRNVFKPCLKSKVQHNHPSWGASEADATYRKSGAKIERDHQIYVERMRKLKEIYG